MIVENGSFRRVTGKEAIAQRVATRLRFVRGEWYQNRDQGTPYYESIFADGADDSVRRAVLGRVVRETPGVKSLDQMTFELEPVTRRLFVTITGTTVDDEVFVLDRSELQL